MRTLRKRVRWFVARTVDRLPGQCWADLVSWAHRSEKGLPWAPQRTCRTDLVDGVCWCGKIQPATAKEGLPT